MNTLFVYSFDNEAINSLCRVGSYSQNKTEALQLSSYSDKSVFSRFLWQNRRRSRFSDYNVDFKSFDRIIIACDEFAGEISPEIADFISNNDFRYKCVDCVVFGVGRLVKRAEDSIKIRISLSGGTVRNCICVSTKELKKENEDLLFSLRHRLAV